MIRLESVVKLYGQTVAVQDLSFSVEKGEFTVLIGPSGCGKSTTLRLINRLIPITSGRILVDERPITSYRPEDLRRGIGYAIQNIGLFPHMTVGRNIAVVPELLKWEAKRTFLRMEELLDLVGLAPAEYRDKYPRQLSGGEAQRVGVARALAADPDILLMDEPFGAVDPITRETLQAEFSRIQKELRKTIVFVTHDIDEAIRLADRIIILRDGRLVQHGTPEEILTSPADRFVLEFIGADRALKRLSRLTASGFMRKTPAVLSSSPVMEAAKIMAGHQYTWVTNDAGEVVGWLDRDDLHRGEAVVAEVMTAVSWKGLAVMEDATLKEALSRMVQQGIASAPVVDRKGVLQGEISLEDVLNA